MWSSICVSDIWLSPGLRLVVFLHSAETKFKKSLIIGGSLVVTLK